MKILLFGEFSGLFTCLKEGFEKLGHEVFFVSDGDHFKDFPADFRYDSHIALKLGKFNQIYCAANLQLHRRLLRGYDVVLLISPSIVSRRVVLNRPIYKYLIQNNKTTFLCGTGSTSIMTEYWYKSNEKYYPYVKGYLDGQKNRNVQIYPNAKLKAWEEELLDLVDGYIPIWYEYAQPYRKYKKIKKTIRIPITCEKFEYRPNIVKDKIVFFHGVSSRPFAKGTPLIKKAFDRMERRYGDIAEFVCAGGLPFDEYIKLISRINVILDDANSYSIAMNGLFSMAKGKVVMGGAEPEGNKELGIEGVNPVINLRPDVDQICSQIEYVINNRDKIEEWGFESRKFVENYHDYIEIAKEYIKVFEDTLKNK